MPSTLLRPSASRQRTSDPRFATPQAVPRAGLRAIAGVAVLATLVWFTVPVFAGHYNEGFQNLIVMNAGAILHGGADHVDLLYKLVNDFFLASRLGLSLVMAGLLKLGIPAVTGFRLVMLVSLVVLVGANAAILVRHYRVPLVFACVPALLFPGLFESAWFFNDNVLSAALSSTALALFWSRRTLPATAGCAVLWGLAITCRTDAVLLAPAFLVLMWFELPGWGVRVRHALLAAPIVAAVPLLIYAALGLNFLDILPLTHRATVAWARNDPVSHVFHPLLKGIAYPGMVLMAAGAISVIVRRQWREILFCLGVPLVYAAAYGLLLTEVRYLLPLAPSFAILMVEGARAMLAAAPRRRTIGLTVLGLAFLTCFAPPVGLPLHSLYFLSTDDDMPRPSVGRFWSPVLSLWWNHTLEAGFEATGVALEAAAKPGGLGVVVSTRWTPDHSVELLLREHGFTGVSRHDASVMPGDRRGVHAGPRSPVAPEGAYPVDPDRARIGHMADAGSAVPARSWNDGVGPRPGGGSDGDDRAVARRRCAWRGAGLRADPRHRSLGTLGRRQELRPFRGDGTSRGHSRTAAATEDRGKTRARRVGSRPSRSRPVIGDDSGQRRRRSCSTMRWSV